MEGIDTHKAILQGACTATVVLAACAGWWFAAHKPPDAKALSLAAETARSQAIEAQKTGQFLRKTYLPRNVGLHHVAQLRKQVARNRKAVQAQRS